MPTRRSPRRSNNRIDTSTGLPVGWETSNNRSRRIGFIDDIPAQPRPSLIHYDGDGHLLTIAPTASGKGRSALIPALLAHPGPSLTLDVKAEAYHVTARHRREMGHRVVALDPFNVALDDPDTFNPFDLFQLPGSSPDVDAELLGELLGGSLAAISHDQFWDRNGKALLVGLVGLAAEQADPHKRNVGQVLDILYADDVDYRIAVELDTHKFSNQLARQELCAYLNHESEKVKPSVRSTAQCFLKCLGSEPVRRSLSATSFDLNTWLRGDPIDIFLIFPPDKLESHRALLRLLLGTLLNVITRRKEMPAQRTLLLLDEIAQCGPLPQLRGALTLLRGFGVQIWSMWQDLSQIKTLYPTDWESILNNSAVLQVFGTSNGLAARALADILDLASSELMSLDRAEQALLLPGKCTRIGRRVDYLIDPCFAGKFDANPRYAKRNARELAG